MFDPTTLSAYAAGATPAARAQAVRDSLGSGTLTVELRDGETLVYTGTFAGPMTAGGDGSLSADVLLTGAVTTGGTPAAATWTCRIRNADGRYIEGSFGPGGRFTWSGGALVVGQAVRLAVSIAAAGASSALPLWLRTADAGGEPPLLHWGEIPNSKLSECPVTWAGPGTVPPPDTGTGVPPRAKLNAWNGATLRNQGSLYMIACSGGHGDYAGNEVNAIALGDDVIAGWQELCPPSPYEAIVNLSAYYLDLKPSSIHTYWSLQFDQTRNRLLRVSQGGLNMGSMPSYPEGWEYVIGGMPGFELATNEWLPPTTLATMPGGTSTGSACCADPTTGDVYWVPGGGGQVYKYTAATNAWGSAGYSNNGTSYCGMALDHTRGRILKIGAFTDASSGYTPKVFSVADGANIAVTFGGLGEEPISVSGTNPGVVYDPINDCFWVMLGAGVGDTSTDTITLHRVDAATWEVSTPVTTGATPLVPSWGPMNKIQFAPEIGCLVIANRYTENMKFLRVA